MDPFREYVRNETRRQFLSRGSNAVSWAAMAALLMTGDWAARSTNTVKASARGAKCSFGAGARPPVGEFSGPAAWADGARPSRPNSAANAAQLTAFEPRLRNCRRVS